jgi:hypothetical protein
MTNSQPPAPGPGPDTAPETAPETAVETAVASRPRLVTRWRLLPVAVVCSLTLALGVAGVFHDGVISTEQPAAAAPAPGEGDQDRAQRRAERASKKCVPGFNTKVGSEPWSAARRRASERTYKARIRKEDASYVKGAKGWYHFSDLYAKNFSQALGRVTHTTKKQKQWAKYFEKARKLTEAQGGTFHIVVAPATWEVHPEKLPAWAKPLRGTNSLAKLMKAYPKLPWIDTRKALLASAKKGKPVYAPTNSHWTPYGGYVAWQAIARCLATDRGLDKVGVPPLSSVKTEKNVNEFAAFGIKPGKKAWTVPVYASALPATTQTQTATDEDAPFDPYGGIDAVYLPAVVSTPGAQSDQTLLVYRDSTGSALSPLWRYSYQTSYQYHHGILSTPAKPTPLAKAIAAADPDVFLYVVSERMLDGKPPRA